MDILLDICIELIWSQRWNNMMRSQTWRACLGSSKQASVWVWCLSRCWCGMSGILSAAVTIWQLERQTSLPYLVDVMEENTFQQGREAVDTFVVMHQRRPRPRAPAQGSCSGLLLRAPARVSLMPFIRANHCLSTLFSNSKFGIYDVFSEPNTVSLYHKPPLTPQMLLYNTPLQWYRIIPKQTLNQT